MILVGVQEEPEDGASRRPGHVDHPDDVDRGPRTRARGRQGRSATLQERLVEADLGIVREERDVADRGLDEVLEEVGAEREVRHVVPALSRDLDEHGRVVDVRVGHGNAEAHVAAAAPPPRPHEHELPLRQDLVETADGLADPLERRRVGERRVAVGIDVDDVREVRHAPVRDVAARLEDHPVGRQVGRDRGGRRRRPRSSAAGTAEGRGPVRRTRTRCRPGRASSPAGAGAARASARGTESIPGAPRTSRRAAPRARSSR